MRELSFVVTDTAVRFDTRFDCNLQYVYVSSNTGNMSRDRDDHLLLIVDCSLMCHDPMNCV